MTEPPPIPPNCEKHFVYRHELFRVPKSMNEQNGFTISIDDPPIAWKPIIAAVARCAWLDEAERLFVTGNTSANGAPIGYCSAIDNAKEWRKWGEQQ